MPHASGKNSVPTIIPREYIAGAIEGIRKFWWAFKMPITSPLMPNKTTEGSMMRNRRTVSTSCTGSDPGTSRNSPSRTICGAKIKARMLITISARNTRLVTPEASRQAPSRSSFARKLVNIGMKADPNAPPATKLNSSSTMRLAALNESNWAEVPKRVRDHNPPRQAHQVADDESHHHRAGGAGNLLVGGRGWFERTVHLSASFCPLCPAAFCHKRSISSCRKVHQCPA
jgi:hypothetical protein